MKETEMLVQPCARVSCAWCRGNALLKQYHDEEWGIHPLHDDQKQFEFLTLETMQCGLSWMTVLNKREAMRAAFDGFDPRKIAVYDEDKLAALLQAPGIIHSAPKLRAMVGNARAFLTMEESGESFSDFVWSFVENQPQISHAATLAEIPTTTPASDALSKALKKRGFKCVGFTSG